MSRYSWTVPEQRNAPGVSLSLDLSQTLTWLRDDPSVRADTQQEGIRAFAERRPPAFRGE
jgi:hypothetical protein